MAAHVAERAGAVADALPPVARMIDSRLERTRLADANPAVPVERWRHRVGAVRNRVGVAPRLVAERVDLANLADRTLANQPLGDELRLVRRDLDAHLRRQVGLPCVEREDARFAGRQRQRLLDVDRFSQRHRRHGNRGVHVIRRRDVDRVDVRRFLAEHLAPVLVDAHVGEQLLHLFGPPEVDVGHRHQGERRMAGEGANIRQRLPGGADAGVPHLAILGKARDVGERAGNGRPGDAAQKRAPRY